MFYILSDTEVALNELLVEGEKTVGHYEDAIQLTANADNAEFFQNTINQRKTLLEKLTTAIRELGDLPAEPDPDKETSEIIIEHVGATLAQNNEDYIISHRIKAEENLQSLVDNAREMETELSETHRALLLDISQHIDETIKALHIMNKNA